jgi:hypothetical protein
MNGLTVARLSAALTLAAGVLLSAQQQLPDEPPRGFGTSVTPSYEGWFDNPDGTHNLLIGYLNRNRALEVDVPIGPNNHFEPGNADMGQPTHFLSGRHTGVFIVTVPKEFNAQQRLSWSITFNGQTNTIPFHLQADYNVSPLRQDFPPNNTPPSVRLFDEKAAGIQGPVGTMAKAVTRTTSVSSALELPVWAEDDAKYTSGSGAPMTRPRPPVTLTWSVYRGPGKVTFDKARPELETLKGGAVNVPYGGKAKTTAKFSAPGEYVLYLVANDYSGTGGGAGEICCWTNALVKVTVTP